MTFRDLTYKNQLGTRMTTVGGGASTEKVPSALKNSVFSAASKASVLQRGSVGPGDPHPGAPLCKIPHSPIPVVEVGNTISYHPDTGTSSSRGEIPSQQ